METQITSLEIQLLLIGFLLNPEQTLKYFFFLLNPLMIKCMCRCVVPRVSQIFQLFLLFCVGEADTFKALLLNLTYAEAAQSLCGCWASFSHTFSPFFSQVMHYLQLLLPLNLSQILQEVFCGPPAKEL